MMSVALDQGVERSNFDVSLAQFRPRRSGGEPAWLGKLRREAMARFHEMGFPTTGQEDWKYTSVAPLTKIAFRLPEETARLDSSALAPFDFPSAARIVFVNGRYCAGLSFRDGLPEGVRVMSLAEALGECPEALEPHLARLAPSGKNAFSSLNTAFLEDGAFVHLAPGAAELRPIHLIFYSAVSEAPTVSSPRSLIVAEAGSQLSLVETYAGAADNVYFTNAVTEVAAGEGSVIDHTRLQWESESAFHIGSVEVSQERDSVFRSLLASLGAALARNEYSVRLGAPGAECELNGLFTGRGTQHVDNHTLIDHAAPHGTSRELFKGVMAGKARGIFHGKIVVRPDAQKTDALQTNKNLLLSREALVNSTPALEIHADDVKCKHGSTIGQLDEKALFYLRSRGIGEREARGLLTYAFAADITARVKVEPLRERLEAFLRARLGGEMEA